MQRKALGKGLSALMPARRIDSKSKSVAELPIDSIALSTVQPRQEMDPEKLNDLINSIKEQGVIQPLLVRPKDEGYELIAGERRLRAAQSLGFTQVPVIIKEVDDDQALQLSLIENIQREDLNPIEQALAYRRLVDEFGYTHERIAQLLGKDISSITNFLRLLKLPDTIQAALRNGNLLMGHARTILGIKDIQEQDRVFRRTITHGLSVRELESIVRKRRGDDVGKRKRGQLRDPHLVALAEQLQRLLGTRVQIVAGRKRGKVIMEYYSDSDLERIIKLLKRIK